MSVSGNGSAVGIIGDPGGDMRASDGVDCDPDDPWVGPGAEEICGDWVDDDCDGTDAPCPTTAAAVSIPSWDCEGTPPADVYAWAPYEGGMGCSVYFADEMGAIYFATLNVSGECPGGFQERHHAWSTVDGVCEDLLLISYFDFDKPSDFSSYGPDFNYDQQPTSSACRKVLMFLGGNLTFSYVTSSVESLERRLTLFPTIEIGCHEWMGTTHFPWVGLSKTAVVRNDSFGR